MNLLLQAFVNRMREPSSWAGVAAIVAAASQAVATKDPNAIGAVVAGVAALVLPEGKAK